MVKYFFNAKTIQCTKNDLDDYRLGEIERPVLHPGQTASVLPLNDGIHKAGNPAGKTSVMLCVYGTPIRRLYVNRYDHLQNRVNKLYPPRLRKKMLASRALETLGNSSEIIRSA